MWRLEMHHLLRVCCAQLTHGHGAVVIAVSRVRVMQMPADEVVDVVPMWDRLMPAVRTVGVRCVVLAAVVLGGAAVRVSGIYLQGVLIHVILVRMVQMAVVQIVDVISVLDRRMPAARAVSVIVSSVRGVLRIAHDLNIGAALRDGKQIGMRSTLMPSEAM